MSTAETAPPADLSSVLSALPPVPAPIASLLSLSSRINALEQALSFEASSSPPLSVHLPPLPPPPSASPSTSTPSPVPVPSSRRSRDALAPSASSPSLFADSAPSLSFLSKVQELTAQLQTVEDESVQRFFSLHSSYEALLSSSAPLSSFLSSAAVKQQLLLSHYDTVIAAQRDLQALAALLPSLVPPPLSLSPAQLTATEEAQRLRVVEVAQLHVAVDRFIAAYDDAVHALNGIVVSMDRKVRKWEAAVTQVEQRLAAA